MSFNFKFYNEKRLITLIIVLFITSEFLLKYLFSFLENHDLSYYRFYPATALLVMIFVFLNEKLHKAPWLWRKLIKVPLIRGTYEGHVKFNYEGMEVMKKSKLIITQTTSKIKVNCSFWEEDETGEKIEHSRTESESLMEDLILKENDLYELLFYYRQKGSNDSSIPIREGFNTLTYKTSNNTKRLEGSYFVKNGRTKGNGGSINVDFITKELNHL